MGLFEQGQTIKAVCTDCNTYFGKYVDPVFAEDTYEAILRTKQGLKTPAALQVLRYERINITIPGDGWWAGARLKFKEQNDETILDLPAQMGFLRKSTQKYEYFLLGELDDVPDWTDFETKNWKVMSVNEEDENKLKEFCTKKFGASTTFAVQDEKIPAKNGELEVELTSRIDELVKRAVCKIAFNYLAKQIPREKSNILLDASFNDIRDFVRKGTPLAPERIKISVGNENSILKLPENQGVYAHLIVLDYSSDGALHCRFSPYDHLHYDVLLNVIGPIVEPVGHAFLYKTEPKVCKPLFTSPETKTYRM